MTLCRLVWSVDQLLLLPLDQAGDQQDDVDKEDEAEGGEHGPGCREGGQETPQPRPPPSSTPVQYEIGGVEPGDLQLLPCLPARLPAHHPAPHHPPAEHHLLGGGLQSRAGAGSGRVGRGATGHLFWSQKSICLNEENFFLILFKK